MFTRFAMVLVPLHATPNDQPPPLTPTRLLTEWSWEWWMALGIAIAAALYIAGLVVLHRRGVRWPMRRSLSFLLGGLGSIGLATMSALGHLRHGALQRPHRAAHDLDDGGSTVPRAGGAGHSRARGRCPLDRAQCCSRYCTHEWPAC